MTPDAPTPRSFRRLPFALLALAAVTCSDDTGQPPGGRVNGTVYMSEPVRGATVDVVRFDGGQAGATICSTITDDAGAYACDLGKLYGDLIVVATGGTTTENGAALTLPAGATLRAPALGVAVGEQHTTQVNPASDLVLAVGLARTAANKDGGFAASVARAHALVREHLEVDPVAVAPAALDATTTLTEPVKLALFQRGLGTLAATIAAEQSLTAVALNSRTLHDRVIDDASSAEAQLDGVGKAGGNALTLGPSCALPMGCTTEGAPMCVALCWVETNTLRARVAAGALAFLRSPANHTGLTREDALPWATHLQNNASELFGSAQGPEGLDSAAPVVSWNTPAADQVFGAGQAISVDVTATDALGVASLVVVVDLPTPIAIADTDPAPEHFQGTLALTGLPEGPLPLLATAIDIDGNDTPSPRSVVVDQVAGGTVSGSAYKARLANAPVAIYTFTGGTRGATPVGTGTTQPDGSFTNVLIAENTSGPLLVEVGGGGTYAEDSQPATVVTLDVNDVLRTIIPAFTDGGATSGVVVSPATELAVSYFTWLNNAGAGGADLAARWATAHGALETMLGIASVTTVQPSDPAQIDTLTAADRYGLVLLGISRTAWAASTSGGGDAGAFGPTINAQKVTNLWSRDIRDGCLDGKAGATPLSYGGVGTLTDEVTRLQLAQAIVAYLGDGARNVTAFTTPAEVLPLLDTLAQGGGNVAPGSCTGAVAGHLFDDNGRSFDRDGPLVAFDGGTPPAGAFVRGSIMVDATATDVGMLDPAPTLRIVTPAGTVDTDGDTNDRDIHATFDTATAVPGGGPLTVVLDGFDHSGNHSDVAMSTRTFTVDNTPPVVAITAPAMDGQFLRPPVTVQYTVTEANVMTTTALLDGMTSITPGFQVALDGPHNVSVSVVDRAGNTASATRTFTVDNIAPVLSSVVAPTGSVVKSPLTITATATDNFMASGSLGTDIVSTGTPAPTTSTPASTGGNRSLAVTYTALADGPFTVRFNISDRAGNMAVEHVVTRTIDGTPPVLTWSATGLTQLGADYWAGSATPTLTGNVSDSNLATVIATWAGGMATATVAGGTWTVALPSAANLGLPGLDVTVTATDLAGNPTAITRHLRADVTPPVVGFGMTLVRQEDKDSVNFDPNLDPMYGKKKYNPTHAHSAAFTTTLGPATACDATAPRVVKYAYLLDQAPPFALETGGLDAGGANALKWQLDPSDDGVGLTSVRWRVVDVATGMVIHNWATLASPVTTLVPLYRVGANVAAGTSGSAALGTAQGLLRFEAEATDRLNRVTTATRCWNQTLLAAPIVLDPNDQAVLPSNTAADVAANKWGLSSLNLESTTTPAAPVSMMLTTPATASPAGAGLFEFPIYNPTNEPVYVSVDLDLPAPIAMGSPLTSAKWTRSSYDGRWVYREAVTNTICGSVLADGGPPAIYEPNYSLAGCENGPPAGNNVTLYTDTDQNVPAADFTVRAWTTDQITTTLAELTQCVGCSITPSVSGRVRVTILVPPRGATTTLPPVKVVLMATLRPSSDYRPHGMTGVDIPTEFPVGSQRLTGQSLASATQCVQWNAAPGPLPSGGFKCTRTRYYTKARYLNAISVTNVGPRTAYLTTGLAGSLTTAAPHLSGASSRSFDFVNNTSWSTSEPSPPAL